MKQVATMIRTHFDGIVVWTRSRRTNGFIEAINGLFQAAKRKAGGYTRLQTMKTVLFQIAGKSISRPSTHTPLNPLQIQSGPFLSGTENRASVPVDKWRISNTQHESDLKS
jgi:hypothetical protein